jgi:alpha-L-arabinofuranosidase
VVDDHYYRSAAEMARDSGHYDNYSRKDPKIFVGEWASTEGTPTPTLQAALGDAAWLTGLERDSDVVVMEAYAPLLVNVNRGAFQWGTNLIGYDNMTSFGSPSYYVQSMFARYTGKQVVPSEVSVNLPSVATPAPHGAVGLATWLTDAEYKDMELTQDGRTERLTSDGALAGWRSVRGAWTLDSAEGAVRQTSNEENTLATFGEPNWTNYTYHLKARKLSGDEGFMIPFHVVDAENYWFWNVGGWNNRRTALQEKESGGNREASRVTRMTVETGRWYDIKIEVGDGHIRCYLDGKLVTEADEKPEAPVSPIYVAASRARNGKLFLKVVNFSNQDADLNLNFDGHVGKSFQGLELSGERGATNSIAEPTKVEPNRIRLMGSGTSLKHLFPARSVTVLTG